MDVRSVNIKLTLGSAASEVEEDYVRGFIEALALGFHLAPMVDAVDVSYSTEE